jgi:hypothetical protein
MTKVNKVVQQGLLFSAGPEEKVALRVWLALTRRVGRVPKSD